MSFWYNTCMKSTHKLRVLVVLSASNKPEQDHISGILRYEATHSDCAFDQSFTDASNGPSGNPESA